LCCNDERCQITLKTTEDGIQIMISGEMVKELLKAENLKKSLEVRCCETSSSESSSC
jgi:hypothetical protein